MSVGPGSATLFKITRGLSNSLLEHTKYVSNLKLWDKFIIWRYTLGSGSINANLIGFAKDEQIVFWTYNFFNSYNYSPDDVHKDFKIYLPFFAKPRSYLYSPTDGKVNIAKELIGKYISQLQRLILLAPIIKDTFEVWKVSSYYPELPDKNLALNIRDIVHQKPFNSTTYNPQTSALSYFIAEDATCCLHKITVEKGNRVLLIPAEYHAYPFELECLLPFDSDFEVNRVFEYGFDYIPKEQQKLILTQDPNNLVIGQVYMIDPQSDNKVKHKKLRYYVSKLVTPK